jgi:gamma-glutamyltranspeptidase / glutathione hydrolase
MPIAFLALLAAATPGTSPAREPVPGRSVVASRYGVVASSQPLAASAGVQILERGGNAVDAAIAANATTGVTEPTGSGIGGDLFALVYVAKEDKLYGLNASGWSAKGMTPEFVRSKGIEGKLPQRGPFTVTVPGVVAGWDALRKRFGALPLSVSLAPAIFHAENGFPVMEITAGGWARSEEMLGKHPNSRATFLIDGRAPTPGQIFKNPDLARSLRRIADQGRDGYYKGPTAQAIVDIVREQGGAMALEDLAEFQPEWVQPIQTTYRGWTVSEIPPSTQGIAALEMLNLLERFPLAEWGFHSTRSLHAMIEAKKLAYADLLRYVGDPRFGQIPVAELLDKERAAARAARIDPAAAACKVEPAKLAAVTDAKGSDTIYLTVVDRDGNVVSLIQSNYSGFGSGLVPKDKGFMLHNRGALFTLEPGLPNTLAPRKRPIHTIIPGFLQKGELKIGFGIMGGWNQAQAHAQFVVDVVDYGMSIQQALEAGRFTKETFEGCDVEIESSVPEQVRAQLAGLGHKLEVRPPRTHRFGYGQAVIYDARTGVKFGASDPRHDGEAIPVPPPVFEPARERR